MSKHVQIVSNNGRVSMSAELREADFLQAGDQVTFRTDEQGQIIIEKTPDDYQE
ncbi:AbrB/MazE/SpoVT family DNA-binding domain-containing protein [Lentilactobacillus hilgardii]|uniref:AbrB/MazE/SpoVT family DNA-binding domain-containing protein n=1 Tax=Lentilactobacillus hilgardii TaxID=1588 RepID=UPI00019C4B0F|nr:AbrB/MazE/SpoVT family DNA-binding domain-containing protein [Lentilactobacillus hilgardii]EEI20204.1 SpoVT/AbrB-like protein [Lentilactobacillus buchneri ATCC 11577]MCP9334452.1 AbrB/MazE/SpoVT family DNA-binding domain-containing protein [Lentilactobacillus hilgardii]MCP9351050.1 AbrB/MazE/SpoVT family DNA-binding domain-containing protein [Lentilactobacillus hilgardii]MCP9353890.1 AbrB/MazE/SpoVT family DNA-binding domain-containing protein [Lentilactobacillus hilgardii]QIR08692.1 hypoth